MVHHQPIDRLNWRYWLDGAGSWATRWECTGHDVLLFTFMSVGLLWMVAEYFWYARLLEGGGRLMLDYQQRIHMTRLMRVFVFCGCIHLSNIVLWFWTPHYIWAGAYYFNAWLAHSLNRSFAAAIAKSLSDLTAESRLQEIGQRLETVLQDEESVPMSLREHAEELLRLAGRRP